LKRAASLQKDKPEVQFANVSGPTAQLRNWPAALIAAETLR
jgi:hypothetical protein